MKDLQTLRKIKKNLQEGISQVDETNCTLEVFNKMLDLIEIIDKILEKGE